MPQLRQQCADVGSRMKMQQVYAQQCVQSLGWQIWNLEWSVLPRQLRCLDSNSRAMRIWIQQTFIWPVWIWLPSLSKDHCWQPRALFDGSNFEVWSDVQIDDDLNTFMLELPGWILPLLLAFGHGSGQVRHTKGWQCRIPGIKNHSHAANVRIFDLDLGHFITQAREFWKFLGICLPESCSPKFVWDLLRPSLHELTWC